MYTNSHVVFACVYVCISVIALAHFQWSELSHAIRQ